MAHRYPLATNPDPNTRGYSYARPHGSSGACWTSTYRYAGVDRYTRSNRHACTDRYTGTHCGGPAHCHSGANRYPGADGYARADCYAGSDTNTYSNSRAGGYWEDCICVGP